MVYRRVILAGLLVLWIVCQFIQNSEAGSFYIDFNNNTFMKDGKPFRYISGSIHSYRVPRAFWQDRLDKMWAAGLNAIQIYIFWNEHEPYPGVYDFDGQNDVYTFIQMAQKTGFLVILRAGPYACAEHDYGGLPWWLLSAGTDKIKPRTNDSPYMVAVQRWYDRFLPNIAPLLYRNGGPIITVQIENEYGSFGACDKQYLSSLKDIFRQHLGDDVVYFTTDGDSVGYLKCGTLPGAYSTVDFGCGANVNASFNAQRAYSPYGPLVNSEFYPGWLDNWGQPHQKVPTESVIKTFTQMLDLGANVNFYMFHGGTNFGFSNGADPEYNPQPTSYDYDAPISEAGDVTDKYLAIRNTISKYTPVPQVPIPANSTKKAYGNVQLYHIGLLTDVILQQSDQCVESTYPLRFEDLAQGYGLILYSTTLDDPNVDGKVLSIPGIRDRGYIQIGESSIGVVYRNANLNVTIKLKNNQSNKLYIIVENMGRVNYGNNVYDSKGLVSNVTLDGIILKNWQMCRSSNFIPNFQSHFIPPDYENKKGFAKLLDGMKQKNTKTNIKDIDYNAPGVYAGVLNNPDKSDTFLRMDKFNKGIAFMQSIDTVTNLGRYWPHIGPQVTLYVPGVFITPSYPNIVVLIELEGSSCSNQDQCYVEFLDYPILNGPVSKTNVDF